MAIASRNGILGQIATEDFLPNTTTFLNNNKNKEYKRYSWKTATKDIAGT
jgi:hypothetical protein